MPRNNPFHDHLDVCKQCRDNPFGLCQVGTGLINEAAKLEPSLKMPNFKCLVCNGSGKAQPCPGCGKVDPYLKAYQGSLVDDETGDPNS